MQYRSKLYISLAASSCTAVCLSLAVFYLEAKRLVLQQVRSKATSIAVTAASFIDGDELPTFDSIEDEKTHAFITLHTALLKVRDANRSEDIEVKYVYIMRKDPQNPEEMVFVVDAHPNQAHRAHPGEPYHEAQDIGLIQHLDDVYVPDVFIKDRWGSWLSAFVPIRNHRGEYVATLGVDLKASEVKERLLLLMHFGFVALGISLVISIFLAFLLSRKAAKSLGLLCQSMEDISKGNLDAPIHLASEDEFQDLAAAIRTMCTGLREKEKLKGGFSRYVAQPVLDKLLASDISSFFKGEKRKVTILFSDIRQFTHLAEKLTPEQTVSLMNEYFSAMLDIIFEYHGTLDKFIGDGIMVEFGAPLEDPEQETHAIFTALAMQKKVKELSDTWESEGKPRIRIGIGIHTGYAVMGNIGSEKRMEYTAIGDTVNIASRLEQATKVHKVPILVSESTFTGAQSLFSATNLGPISLPGRTEEIVVYAIESEKEKSS